MIDTQNNTPTNDLIERPPGKAHLITDRIALAIAVTDARLGRKGPPYHSLTEQSPELHSLHMRAAVAVNLGDQQALDAALEDVASAIHRQAWSAGQHRAEDTAALAIATWIASMSAPRGER